MNIEFFRSVAARLAVLCLGGLSALGVQANQPLSLAQALERTLAFNPTLSQYPYRLRELEAQRLQAGLRPNPNLNLELENVLGSGQNQGIDNADITLSFSQLIELGDKRQMRVNVQDQALQQQNAQYEWDRLRVLAETTKRFYQVLNWQQLREWNRQRIQKITESLNIIRVRAAAGAVSDADVSRMAYRLAEVELEQQGFDSEFHNARYQLSQQWLQSPDFDALQGDIRVLPASPSLLRLEQAVNDAPELLLLQQQYALEQTSLRLAQANGKADVTLDAGLRYSRSGSDGALVFGLSMPLNLNNPNQGNIDAARARLDGVSFAQAQLRQALRSQVKALAHQERRARERVSQLDRQLLPQAQKLLVSTRAGYQHGQISVLQLLDAQEVLFNAQRQLIEAHFAVFETLLNMQRLTGQPLIEA